jgi:tRNA-2-methylthio-N6-dimethylallyladenosine synthase
MGLILTGLMRYFVQTFGCQMNVHDSSAMSETLLASGFEAAESAEAADVVILNTCSVREKAEQKLRSEVGKLKPLKAVKPGMLFVVAGCVASQEGQAILTRIPYVDLVLGPDNIPELPALLRSLEGGAPPLVRTEFDVEAPLFLSAVPSQGRASVSAFVTTMKGCDERCSFCVVPTTRGPERYRHHAEILNEARAFVAAGAREITLLGQTVDSFRDESLNRRGGGNAGAGATDPDESQFPELLRRIASDVPGLLRLRYTSPHPRHLTESLIAAHRELDVLAQHVHMPVQSGSDRILRRMIRRYTRAEYVSRVQRLQAARPHLTLSTDIIVGFPGETEEDFLQTLSLVREVGFTSSFGFTYSQRPHTAALRLPDDVPLEEKKRRLARLFEVSEGLQARNLGQLVGSTQHVLIEGPSKAERDLGPSMQGRTRQSEIVHVIGVADRDVLGRELEVRITRSNRHSLIGEVSAEGRSALPQKRASQVPVRLAVVS